MSVRYLLILLAVLEETASASLSFKEAKNASASLSLKETAWGTSPCTAALGLQPVLISDQASNGLLRQGDWITARVYAVNLCVEDFHMTPVDATIRGKDDHDFQDNGKRGRFCIKPASQFNEQAQQYVPQTQYFKQGSVKFSSESLSIHPKQDPNNFELTHDVPYWCSHCANGGCFTVTLKDNFPLYASDDKRSIYLFTIEFQLSDTITAEMAGVDGIVFQAQTRPAAVKIDDHQRCNGANEGGGQGTAPYRFAQATSTSTITDTSTTRTGTSTTRTGTSTTRTTTGTTTTTMCMWPCCKELRNFMDNVADFIQEKYDHDVSGGGAGVCSEKCSAASDDECPAGEAAPRFIGLADTPPVSEVDDDEVDEVRSSALPSLPSPVAPAEQSELRECFCAPAPAPPPAPPDTCALNTKHIALIVTLSVLCAVLVQVVAGLLFPPAGAGARESSYDHRPYAEPLLRQ